MYIIILWTCLRSWVSYIELFTESYWKKSKNQNAYHDHCIVKHDLKKQQQQQKNPKTAKKKLFFTIHALSLYIQWQCIKCRTIYRDMMTNIISCWPISSFCFTFYLFYNCILLKMQRKKIDATVAHRHTHTHILSQ